MALLKALIGIALIGFIGGVALVRAAGFEEDVEAIAALREAGADLTQPLLLEFIFHFDQAEDAQNMWNTLAGDGFKGQIRPGGAEPGFLLFARKSMLVEEATLARLREKLEQQARKFNGSYEGWGAP